MTLRHLRTSLLALTLMAFVGGCSKDEAEKPSEATSEKANKKDLSGLKDGMAKKPRNLTENPLLKKGELQVDPETLAPYSGRSFKLHADKKSVRSEGSYKEGRKHGLHTSYYEDGTKRSEFTYKDGKKHGPRAKFRGDGSKKEEWHFKEGKLHGLNTRYYKNGTKEREATFKEHKPHGLNTRYYKNGSKAWQARFEEGLITGLYEAWSADGNTYYKKVFKNGTGKKVRFRADGTKIEESYYKDGKKHGLNILYFPNGTKWLQTNYKEGEQHGLGTVYREDGTKERECQYTNNIKGECKEI
jgi:antitoxin component YwqK of YwqJK toxin-antitoxin module